MLSPEKSMCRPSSVTEYMEKHDSESDNSSLQWEDFFGSSLELVPILLDMYDSLVAKNHEEESNHKSVPYSKTENTPSLLVASTTNSNPPSINSDQFKPDNNIGVAIDLHKELFCENDLSASNNFCDTKNKIGVYNGDSQFSTHFDDPERICTSKHERYSENGTLDSGFIDQAILLNTECPETKWNDKDNRPLSISSTSSSTSSSSSLTQNNHNKKSYLASIESLDDDNDDGEYSEDGEETLSNNHSKKFLSSFSSPAIANNRNPHTSLSYIDRVILEILETERAYVKDIYEIIEGYLNFIKSSPDLGISEDNICDLFGNIEVIYKFNKNFLEELEQCGMDPVHVAQCFARHNEGFTVYTHYCTNYPRTVSVLTELMRKSETAKIFRERQAILEHTLPLGSFLLKPVQRILKYHLLLQNIVKYYSSNQAGYEIIVNALATMTGMAHHINDMKRKHEHAVRVQEIQSLLFGWEGQDLTTYGELVAEGMFRMFGAKGIRHVFLFDKMLLIAKKKEGGYLSYKTHIMCSNLMLIESIPGEPYCFHVIPFDNPRIQYTLQSRSLEQKREWSLQLKRVILENYHAVIPYHARQLVMQLGQSRHEDELLIEKNNNTKRQHSAPEYLERRKHEKDRRKSESSLNKALKLKKVSKKSDPDIHSLLSISHRGSRTRSTSGERNENINVKQVCNSQSKDNIKAKEKKSKGWRRKSEPSDFMSSKESVLMSPSLEKKCPSGKQKLINECSKHNSTSDGRPSKTGSNFGAFSFLDLILHPQARQKFTIEPETCSETESNTAGDRWESLQYEHIRQQELEDPSSDYVTFYFSQQNAYQNSSGLNPVDRFPDTASDISDSHEFYQANFLSDNSIPSPDTSCNSHNTSGVHQSSLNFHSDVYSAYSAKTKLDESCSNSSVNSGIISLQHQNLRRTQSFNNQIDKNITISGNERRSLRMRPNNLKLKTFNSFPVKPLEASVNDIKKSDSLPKSFQLDNNHHWSSKFLSDSKYSSTQFDQHMIKSKKKLPFEITTQQNSCHPLSNSDPIWDDFEQYVQNSHLKKKNVHRFPVHREDSEERNRSTGCSSTPAESIEDICTTIHPEHKVYRSSFSKSSLKNMLASVSSRLANIKFGSTTNIDESCGSNANSETEEKEFCRSRSREKNTNKLMCSVARVYSKMIKQRLRMRLNEKDSDYNNINLMHPQFSLPFYRQGSPAIGARMASPIHQSDYSVPRYRHLIKKDDLRPDSVLSVSSNITSSSDGDKTSGFGGSLDTPTTPCESNNSLHIAEDMKDNEDVESDGSADSYYERSFEAIEGLLENEMFRDSAIYSDPEEMDNPPVLCIVEHKKSTLKKKIPPPKPLKPINLYPKKSFSTTTTPETEHVSIQDRLNSRRGKGHCVMQKVTHLEKSIYQGNLREAKSLEGFKTIEQRRRELELWQMGSHHDADESETSSQHSTSTINTVVELPCATLPSTSPPSDQTSMKGWVKHVVGKFQEKN